MSIRCWKCDAEFRPKGLWLYRKTHCPECGCEIDFDAFALVRNCYLLVGGITLTIFLCLILPKKLLYAENRYMREGMTAGAIFVPQLLYYPLACFLYNHFLYAKLKLGRIKFSDRLFPRDTLVLGLVLFVIIVIGAYILIR